MSEQQSGSNRPPSGGGQNNNRRHHPNRNRNRPQGQNQGQQAQQGQGNQNRPQQQGQGSGARPQGQQQAQGQGQNQGQGQGQGPRQGQNRRRHRGNRDNRPKSNQPGQPGQQGQGQGGGQQQHGFNLERIYEKYLNLLDQHLIARRKYHDMFYRAEPAQRAKLERNFYNTMNEVREFENKLAPEARELFEKRNNGLRPDTIYTSNHEIKEEEGVVVREGEVEDPHYLHSQRAADYSGDTEESVGSLDDYLKYKNLV